MVALPDPLHAWLHEQKISIVRYGRAPYRNEPNACIHLIAVPAGRSRIDVYLPFDDTPERSIKRITKALGKARERAPAADASLGHFRGALWAGGTERDFSQAVKR